MTAGSTHQERGWPATPTVTSAILREQMGQALPVVVSLAIARDQMAVTRSLPMVARKTGIATARPPQLLQFQNRPFGPCVRVSILPQFGQVNMVLAEANVNSAINELRERG